MKKCSIENQFGSYWYIGFDGAHAVKEGPFRSEDEARIAARQDGFIVVNSSVSNAKFKPGDKVKVSCGFSVEDGIVKRIEGGRYIVDIPAWGSQGKDYSVEERNLSVNSAPASTNAVVANALTWMDARSGKVATNTIGDCFADAVFHIERAARLVGQKPNSVKSELERAKQLIVGPYGAIKYDPDDRSLKATATKCATAIDKAIADPNVETITAARWACERARAAADGGSPRRTFWSNSAAVTNASRSDEILADFKKFVKAQMSAAIAALETAKRDISAQAETSAKAAKATSSTDEHEIIRDYSGKAAKAIDEAISKLKSAKENPLIL